MVGNFLLYQGKAQKDMDQWDNKLTKMLIANKLTTRKEEKTMFIYTLNVKLVKKNNKGNRTIAHLRIG